MANNKLEDKTFVIPDHVIKTVKPGTMRSDFVIRRKDGLSYYNIKRLKNFYDNQSEKDPKTYQALGEDLKKWVESTLGTHRDSMYKGKKVKSDIGMLNVFKSAHTKDKGNGSHKIRLFRPNTNARQIFTGKGLYENTNPSSSDNNKINEIKDNLSYILDEGLIDKYSLLIESPLYNNIQDIVSDIMYFENKIKKYKK
jgi:hypothetical protein